MICHADQWIFHSAWGCHQEPECSNSTKCFCPKNLPAQGPAAGNAGCQKRRVRQPQRAVPAWEWEGITLFSLHWEGLEQGGDTGGPALFIFCGLYLNRLWEGPVPAVGAAERGAGQCQKLRLLHEPWKLRFLLGTRMLLHGNATDGSTGGKCWAPQGRGPGPSINK